MYQKSTRTYQNIKKNKNILEMNKEVAKSNKIN